MISSTKIHTKQIKLFKKHYFVKSYWRSPYFITQLCFIADGQLLMKQSTPCIVTRTCIFQLFNVVRLHLYFAFPPFLEIFSSALLFVVSIKSSLTPFQRGATLSPSLLIIRHKPAFSGAWILWAILPPPSLRCKQISADLWTIHRAPQWKTFLSNWATAQLSTLNKCYHILLKFFLSSFPP